MKTKFLAKTSIALFLTILFTSGVCGQTNPKTVTEFYLALPSSVSGIEKAPDFTGFADDFYFYRDEKNLSKAAVVKHRKSLIKTEDLKNGYLRLESDWEGWVEIALFKKTDGTYLVALSQVGCGPGCQGDLMFLTYNGGKWKDVTRQIFPVADLGAEGYFQLPRIGTTIELNGGEDCGGDAKCEAGQVVALYEWNKERFIKKTIRR